MIYGGKINLSNFDKLLPHCTVRLCGIIDDQFVSTGTGFYYFFNDSFTDASGNLNKEGTARIGIVTNRHVIDGIEEVVFFFNTSEDGVDGYQKESIRITLNNNTVIFHPDPNVDLCIILPDEILDTLKKRNRKLYFYAVRNNIKIDESKLDNTSTIQNLVMVGYPNGLWDNVNNLPIMRKGINATPLNKNYLGKDLFAIDIATYRGSSGSPVFIYDNGPYIENSQVKFVQRLTFVGILSDVHLSTQVHSESIKTEEMLHVGIAIKAHKIDIFEELVKKHYEE